MPSETALAEAETNAISGAEPSFYRGTGKTLSPKATNGRQLLFKKKKGMAGLILSLALMIGGGAFLSGTNSLLAPALNEVVTEVTDLQHSANSMRYTRLTRHMLNGGATETTWTGTLKYTALSNTTKKNLARNGIEVEGRGRKRVLKYNGETINADDFLDVYKNNIEFRDSYNRARRGRIMGFFDNVANKIYNKLGISRNSFKDYKQTGDAEADTKKFRETMTDELDGDSDNVDAKTNRITDEIEYEEDADGNRVPKTDADGNPITKPTNNETSTPSKDATGDTANAKASSYISKVAGSVQQVTSWGCAVMKTLNMISIAVAANEIYQSINYFMGLAENPSKMKMGYGDDSAINSFLNFMTTPAEVEVENYEDTPDYVGSVDEENLEVKLKPNIKTKGSPMEAQGMQKIMTGAPINTKSVKNYSLERSLNVLGGAVSTTAETFYTCAIAQGATAIASGIVTIAAAIMTGGVSLIASFTWKGVGMAVLGMSAMTFLNFMVPIVAKAFFTNAFENATGIPAGELYAQGAFAANTRIARTGSSQSPSSEAAILAYNQANKEVLALDAEVDRHNRSPFDISSKNTFLGSIAYKFGTTTSTKFTGKIKNLMRTTSSSIAQLTNNAMASGENDYITTYGTCPRLEEIGAKGDIYCNPITTSDLTILDISPDSQTYIDKLNPNLEYKDDGSSTSNNLVCDKDGNCTIVKDSNLAKYITYCDGRDSPFGAVDANILNSLKKGGLASSFLGMVPAVGDALDIADAAQDAANIPWASGQKCVNNAQKNPEWDSEFKYYQLYVQDQRLLEAMGNYEGSKSPVTAYIEEYEAEHPLDNSPSGYLARISGLTKNDAELVLDIAYYYNFLEQYDASTRIAMDGTASNTPSSEEVVAKLDYDFRYQDFEKHFKSDPHATRAIVATHIIYADVRNRSYAV